MEDHISKARKPHGAYRKMFPKAGRKRTSWKVHKKKVIADKSSHGIFGRIGSYMLE